ncbi:hypothetical protein ACFPYI_06755 [Halomarina salina]|uniref:ParB/Sulfiredoxin domain-containing protein n=1 Tax=Halomarina salina TaxID=1872699 RepID=A0ABD5RKH8_9EURY|nr:hypothetical protein [Halomarina salina]
MVLDRFRLGTEWHRWCNERRYDAPADPWEVRWVDPADVEFYNVVSLKWGLGAVMDGDWDRQEHCERLRETGTYRGLEQRFVEGRDWEETRLYERAEARFDEGETVRGFESIGAFRERRCSALDDLYERMRTDGYRPNYETTYDSPADIEYIHEMEPLVLVGRDGELVWSEGFHRHALAEFAGIEEVPVYVLRRHVHWQRRRDELQETPRRERSSELTVLLDHPDVQDIVD